jgi:hypothetical protein
MLACSEYEFISDVDVTMGDTATDTDSDSCGTPDTAPGSTPIDDSCEVEPSIGTWDPVSEWTNPSLGDAYATPVIGHLTDDDLDGTYGSSGDIPDIVVASASGTAYVLSGDGSTIHWQTDISSGEPSTPAIGDLNGDGIPDVVFSGAGGFFAHSGEDGIRLWSSASNPLYSLAYCGGVAIADLDADGLPEVVQGNIILNGQTGAIRGQGAHGQGTPDSYFYSMGVTADIDQDGVQEVVVGNALYNAEGGTIWHNGQSDGFVAVGNFDSDPYGEIVVTWEGNVRLQDHDGTVLWSGNYTSTRIGPPTIADFDGDGDPEIGVAGYNSYIVLEADGSQRWNNDTQDYSSGVTGSAVFDFEGDGAAEVVYADEATVWVYDGATGEVKLSYSQHSSATCTEYPAVADVDNDGQAEIIYVSDVYGSGSFTGVTVLGDSSGSWMPGSQIWNQHAYSITNVNVDGSIPATPDTNWLSYNNFRSGDLAAGQGGIYPDAIPTITEVCTEECAEGRLRVVVQVGNGGMTDMPAGLTVKVYGQYKGDWALLDEAVTTDSVVPGSTTTGMVFDLNADYARGAMKVEVSGNEEMVECDETNNAVESTETCPQ